VVNKIKKSAQQDELISELSTSSALDISDISDIEPDQTLEQSDNQSSETDGKDALDSQSTNVSENIVLEDKNPETDAGNDSNNADSSGTEGMEMPIQPDEQAPEANANSASDNPDSSNTVNATINLENGGAIVLELYPEIAPQSVYNFVYLARQGFYDGLIFHRVIEGFMIQGGDPEGTGRGGPGYCIKGEFTINGIDNPLSHERGVISMARKGDPAYDSAGSQFFIVHQDSTFLDGSYAAFGKVIRGMEFVDEIAGNPTDMYDLPINEIKMKSITISGPELPEPQRLSEQ